MYEPACQYLCMVVIKCVPFHQVKVGHVHRRHCNCNCNCKYKDKGFCISKNYIYNCNSYINIIHNQIDNCYSVCPAAF